jgi:transcriptional regulator with XRE-family HTH domain
LAKSWHFLFDLTLLLAENFMHLCIIANMTSRQSNLQMEARAAAQAARVAGISQQSIADSLGASQSQVSRILSGKSTRRSMLFDEVCIYAFDAEKRVQRERKPSAISCPTLIDAMDAVWDGTERHARALAVVIRSLGPLSHTETPGGQNREGG